MNMADTALALQTHWTRLRPLILKAIPCLGGTYDEADLVKAVMAGEFTFWPGRASFSLAVLERFPKLTRVHVFLSNGDVDELIKTEESIAAWGKALGATELYLEARPALDRMNSKTPRVGFKRRRIVYARTI